MTLQTGGATGLEHRRNPLEPPGSVNEHRHRRKGFFVKNHNVGNKPRLKPAKAVEAKFAGLVPRSRLDQLAEWQAGDLKSVLQGIVQLQGGSGQRAILNQAGDAILDLDIQTTNRGFAIRKMAGAHGIGDQGDLLDILDLEG